MYTLNNHLQPLKKIAVAAMILSGLTLTACSSSSGGSSNSSSSSSSSSSSGTASSTAIGQLIASATPRNGDTECGGSIGVYSGLTFDHDGDAGAATAELPVCTVAGRITSDETLTNDVVWTLTGLVTVGFGNLEVEEAADVALLQNNSVTLTIEAGTLMRNASQSALVITRGSRIMAEGTADAPIIMTSNNDTDFDDRQQWGGLMLQGFGLHNVCNDDLANDDSLPTNPVCNITAEGNAGQFGGNDNTDNSGTLRYVVVAEAGFEVAPNDELNGITFAGVGNGTTVEYIQVHNNFDDGIEFFGGAVNVKYAVLTSNRDDEVDWDEGYVGNIQYVIVRKDIGNTDVTSDPRGIEADNAGGSNIAQPISNPSLANMTFIGDPVNSDQAMLLRVGTGALIYNTVFKDFSPCLDVDSSESNGRITSGDLALVNVFTDCAAQYASDNDDGAGGEYAQNIPTTTLYNGAVTLDAAYAVSAVTTGTFDGFTATSPVEAGGTLDGFFDDTDYAGAVEPGTAAVDAWWAGWIIDGSLP